MKGLSNTEAELKKALLIKKRLYYVGCYMTVQPDTDRPTFSYWSPRGLTKFSQPAHNVLRTSSNVPILDGTSRAIIGPKYDVSGFSPILAVQYLIYSWNQERWSTSQGSSTAADLSLGITYGDVLRTSGRFLGTSSGRPWDVMKSLSNTEAELKKGVAHKKRGYYVGCYDNSTRHRPANI